MRKSPLLLLYPAFLALTLLLAPVRVADALQKPERFVLDNGMVILLMERHALPMVMVNLSFRAGSVWSPPGQEGVAELTATLLTAGTKTRSVKEIPQAIEFVGGALGASAGHDMLGVSLKVLKKDIELGFDLLSDVIKHPTFPPKELERERQEFLAELARQEEEPMTVASKTFSRLVFGPHPYGRPSDGTKESLSQITREQVLQFYKAYLRPQNAVMVVVGDITLQELQDLLDKYFSDWRAGKPEYPALTPAPPLKKREVKVIPKSITQSTVIWGHLGISRSNPDFYALSVANYILGGGGFASRLLTQIRDNMGLAYSVRSAFYANTYPGSFRVVAQTKNESVSKVVETILAEIHRFQKEGISNDELSAAKSHITGSFPLKLDTNSKLASYLASMENYKLGMDYLEKFPDYINAVTREQAQAAARKYINPENYVLVIVGDVKTPLE